MVGDRLEGAPRLGERLNLRRRDLRAAFAVLREAELRQVEARREEQPADEGSYDCGAKAHARKPICHLSYLY